MNDEQFEEAFARAKKRVGARIGFYKHLVSFILINIILLVINLVCSPGDLWFYWPLLGWGVVVFFHALRVVAFPGSRHRQKPRPKKESNKPEKMRNGNQGC